MKNDNSHLCTSNLSSGETISLKKNPDIINSKHELFSFKSRDMYEFDEYLVYLMKKSRFTVIKNMLNYFHSKSNLNLANSTFDCLI